MDNSNGYASPNGEVPDSVAETFDSPSEWELLNPQNVTTRASLIGRLWVGEVDGNEQYVTKRGHASRADHYDYVDKLPEGSLPPSGGPCTYRDDVDVVHHDHYVEHVTRVSVVLGEGQRIVLCSRSGIIWFRRHGNVLGSRDAPEEALTLAVALSDADSAFETPEGYERAVNGWHDSQTPSEQSEIINALSKAELPPEAPINTPYAVKFGDTRNVCSQPASIYADHETRVAIRDLLKGKRATPSWGGFTA